MTKVIPIVSQIEEAVNKQLEEYEKKEKHISNIEQMLVNELENNEILTNTLVEIIKNNTNNMTKNFHNLDITSILINFKNFSNKELTKQLLIELLCNHNFSYTITNNNSLLYNITIYSYALIHKINGYSYDEKTVIKNCEKYIKKTIKSNDVAIKTYFDFFDNGNGYPFYYSGFKIYKFYISSNTINQITTEKHVEPSINYGNNKCICL